MEGLILLVLLAIGIAIAYFCYRIAVRKGRNGALWAVLGLLFGVIALIIVAVLPSKAPSAPSTQ